MPSDETELDLGTPGASARREHARRRANREKRTREQHPWVGGALLAFQGEPRHERAWERGGEGEEVVAQELSKRCTPKVLILHDRRIPRSRANIDHIAVASCGVWVIDSKRYKGKVSVRKPLFGQPKLTIAGRDQSKLIAGLAKQVGFVTPAMREVAPGVPVYGALCFVDAELPLLSKLSLEGYALLRPKQLAKRLNAEGPLSVEQVHAIAGRLATRFPSA